jgi:hypothetical protein
MAQFLQKCNAHQLPRAHRPHLVPGERVLLVGCDCDVSAIPGLLFLFICGVNIERPDHETGISSKC